MCRKEIFNKDKDDLINKYKLYYDCKMFNKYCDNKDLAR